MNFPAVLSDKFTAIIRLIIVGSTATIIIKWITYTHDDAMMLKCRKPSNMSRTTSQNLNDSRLELQ